MLKEFKEFAMWGNVADMAVGIIVGAAFGTIVASLVADVIMPPIGLLLGNVDFSNLFIVLKQGTPPGPYASLADAKAAGAVSINYINPRLISPVCRAGRPSPGASRRSKRRLGSSGASP